ncbi:MAG: AMP-binding protein, partial [Planctomycetota bacterium]
MSTSRLSADELRDLGLVAGESEEIAAAVNAAAAPDELIERWRDVSARLVAAAHPFEVHRLVHERLFETWDDARGPAPAWTPPPGSIPGTNIGSLMATVGVEDYAALHRWSVTDRTRFWEILIDRLGIRFIVPPSSVMDDPAQRETPRWLPEARLNIADTCLQGDPAAVAIIHAGEDGRLHRITRGELDGLTDRVARGLKALGLEAGDAVAIDMPMTAESVAIYLGVLRVG